MSADEREQAEAFKMSVANSPCAVCGRYHFHAHHVVYQQHLPAASRWDIRNALPVCSDCHERHHNGSRRIPRSCLTKQNVWFAREVLGGGADYYLDRHYPGALASSSSAPNNDDVKKGG